MAQCVSVVECPFSEAISGFRSAKLVDVDYASVTDSSNPFNTRGISDEDRALIQYLIDAKAATGIDVVVTCTTDHPTGATRHLQAGTNGTGLAIDCRLRRRGLDIHRAVFELFVPVERQCYELIYADPPSGMRADGTYGPYNIKAGRRVRPYAVSGHHDHNHTAVNRGTFLKYPGTPRPTPEEIMARIHEAVGFAVMYNDDLVVTARDGAIYHFDADGNPDDTDYLGAYNARPELHDSGLPPEQRRRCIGIYAINASGKAVPNGHVEATGYCQVFDDIPASRYRWHR